jgi:hypothetical protein
MIPTQERPGQYWMSGDRADLWFNESGTEAPKTITCLTPQGGHAIVKVDELELLGAGLFGEGRPCSGSSAKWTGDCYRYGVYRGHKPYSGPSIVILQHSGGGMEGLQLDSTTSVETWSHLAATLTPELLWNTCRELFEFHQAALEGQKQRIFGAFALGRLKKSKKKGVIHVTMVAA